MRKLVVGVVVGAFGCGDDARVTLDGSVGGDAEVDAAGGDAGTATLVATTDLGAPISMLDFASTAVGQRTMLTLKLQNDGTVASGPISLAFTGAAENDYVIEPALTTCANTALAAGASCTIAVAFRPLAVGTLTAALSFAASPGGSGQVALSGLAVASGVHFVPPSLALGAVETGTRSPVTVQLRNDGATPAPIDSIEISGVVIARTASTCGSVLAAGAACDITVEATAPTLGVLTGDLSVASDGMIYSAPTIGFGVHRVTVIKGANHAGVGDGTVTSSPAGIDCGATCNDVFTGSVVLTAAPDASSVFTGWSIPGCGLALTCTVPADIPHEYVMAGFAAQAGTASLSIVLAPEAGVVRVHRTPSLVSPGDRLATCYASCTVPVEPGDVLELEGYSLSARHTYSANCMTNADPAYAGTCQVTAGAGTTTVTVTFTTNTGLAWAKVFPEILDRSALDGSGNLIVSMGTRVLKLSAATGTPLWMWPFAITDLATGPGDTIYVVTGTDLMKLGPDGDVLWTRVIPTALGGDFNELLTTNLDVHSDGSVGIHRASGHAVWDGSGTLRWSSVEPFFRLRGIAFEPNGNVMVPRYESGIGYVRGYRYAAADGTRLADAPGLNGRIGEKGSGGGGMGIDANGQVSTSYSGTGFLFHQIGTVQFATDLGPGTTYMLNSIRVAPSGDYAVGTIALNGSSGFASRKTSTSVSLTTVLAQRTSRPFSAFGTSMRSFALGNAGHLAAIGHYSPICPNAGTPCKQLGWAKVIAP